MHVADLRYADVAFSSYRIFTDPPYRECLVSYDCMMLYEFLCPF